MRREGRREGVRREEVRREGGRDKDGRRDQEGREEGEWQGGEAPTHYPVHHGEGCLIVLSPGGDVPLDDGCYDDRHK